MKKRIFTVLAFSFLLIGSAFLQNTEAAQKENSPGQEHKGEHHHHRFIDEALFKSLLEKGYTKKEIFTAVHIAKFSNQKIDDVLVFYKENGSSWEKTAKHYGVNLDEIKKKHHHHMEKFLEKHKDVVLQNVAKYSGKTPQELQAWLDSGIPLRFLVSGAVMAKAADKDLSEIIELKKQGKSFPEIKKELNLEKEQIHAEMRKLVDKIKKDIRKA